MARQKLSLAPEGLSHVVLSAVILLVSLVIARIVGIRRLWWLPVAAGGWFAAVLQFFRDPARSIPGNNRDDIVLSPADGRIILIDNAENGSPPSSGRRVSIFMSPFNVHVNRAPVNGVIETVDYNPGFFRSAFKPAASAENESTYVTLKTPHGKVSMKLIAGFLARRIVFHPRAGDFLRAGERVGMIKFGSRVDLVIPENTRLRVKRGDKVIAGETIIGVLSDE